MDASEQAAEQIVRMTLQGTEVALRLSGAGAKELAAALIAIAQSQKQTKGKTRLSQMLLQSKELKVFQLGATELKDFAKEAKRYGVLYTVVKPAGRLQIGDKVDVMCKAEDAAKINRIMERLDYARTDVTDVISSIEQGKKTTGRTEADKGVQGKDEVDRIVDELFEKPPAKDDGISQNPTTAKTAGPNPSAPISKTEGQKSKGSIPNKAAKDRAAVKDEAAPERGRRSVKAEMTDIRREREKKLKDKAPIQETRHIPPAPRRARKPRQKGR